MNTRMFECLQGVADQERVKLLWIANISFLLYSNETSHVNEYLDLMFGGCCIVLECRCTQRKGLIGDNNMSYLLSRYVLLDYSSLKR